MLGTLESAIVFEVCWGERLSRLADDPLANQVVILNTSKDDNIEKPDWNILEFYYLELKSFVDCLKAEVPTVHMCEDMFKKADKKRDHRVSKMRSAGGQIAWANYEGRKLHDCMALLNRYAKRKSTPRKPKCSILKALWLTHKPHLRWKQGDPEDGL